MKMNSSNLRTIDCQITYISKKIWCFIKYRRGYKDMRNKSFILCIVGICLLVVMGCYVFWRDDGMQAKVDFKDGQTGEAKDIQTTEAVSDIPKMEKTINDLAHESYLMEIGKKEDSEILYDCDFTEYAFFDIDGNGIDELITSNGFFAYIIYTFSDNKIIDLLHIKRGWGEIKIYTDSKCVFSKGGITDCYYDEYEKINGNKSELLASKTWYITHESDTEYSTRHEYSVMGKPVGKNKYKDYVNTVTQSNAITHKDLKWSENK